MDGLYITILDFLNSLFPSAVNSQFSGLNELLAMIFTYGILWLTIVKPVLSVFTRIGKGKM